MPPDILPLHFVLDSGEVAQVLMSDGDKTTIQSPRPSPPGSTVRGNIQDVEGEFQLKVRSCRKQGEHFVIDGRTQNATRGLRAWLQTGQNP